VVDAANTLSDKAREEATTMTTMMGEGGGKMDDVIKVAAVLDKYDKGGTGVNNNVHYDDVDGHRGKTLTLIIMDQESMVQETSPLLFLASHCCVWP
jgi:hypothetical protein